MSDHQETVLVVDDETLIADLWSMTLEDMGLTVCGMASTRGRGHRDGPEASAEGRADGRALAW